MIGLLVIYIRNIYNSNYFPQIDRSYCLDIARIVYRVLDNTSSSNKYEYFLIDTREIYGYLGIKQIDYISIISQINNNLQLGDNNLIQYSKNIFSYLFNTMGGATAEFNPNFLYYWLNLGKDISDEIYKLYIELGKYVTSCGSIMKNDEEISSFSPISSDWNWQSTDNFYIGILNNSNQIIFNLEKFNINSSSLSCSYWNGLIWKNLVIIDDTSNNGVTMSQSGMITFNIPSDWPLATKNQVFGSGISNPLYWLRFNVNHNLATNTGYLIINNVVYLV